MDSYSDTVVLYHLDDVFPAAIMDSGPSVYNGYQVNLDGTDFVTRADFAGTCSERENIEFAGASGGTNVFTSMLTATGVTVEAWINPRRFGTAQGITWKGGAYVLALNDSGQVYF